MLIKNKNAIKHPIKLQQKNLKISVWIFGVFFYVTINSAFGFNTILSRYTELEYNLLSSNILS